MCNVSKLKIAFIINIVNAKFQEDEQLKTLAHKTSRTLKSWHFMVNLIKLIYFKSNYKRGRHAVAALRHMIQAHFHCVSVGHLLFTKTEAMFRLAQRIIALRRHYERRDKKNYT